MTASVNLNEEVRFRLTPEGVAAIRDSDRKYTESARGGYVFDWFRSHKPDADGYYRCQLWSLLNMLAGNFHMGADQVLVGNELVFGGGPL